MRIVFWLLISLFSFHFSYGQVADDEVTTHGYKKAKYFGAAIANSGFKLHYRYGKHITAKKKSLYEIEFASLRHPQEIRQSSNPTSRNYVYGKENYAYQIRLGMGRQKTLAFKPRVSNNGVEVKMLYNIGISNAILKPIYYNVIFFGENSTLDERFDPERHSPFNIIGESNFFKGFEEISYQAGIYGKFAFNFEYADESERIKAIETGIVVDAYATPLNIMAFDKNRNVFVGFYLAFQYGKKYYR